MSLFSHACFLVFSYTIFFLGESEMKLFRIVITVVLLVLAERPLRAGTLSVVPFADDAGSGISAANTYTHLVDTSGEVGYTPTTVNGVAFTDYDWTGANYSITGMAGGFNFTYVAATSGMAKLMRDWFYTYDELGTGLPMIITLTGLVPGQKYDARFYSTGEVIWATAPMAIIATPGITNDALVGYDEFNYGWHYVGYEYIAESTQLTVTFIPLVLNANREFQLYGLSNQLVPEPASLALVGAPVALLLRRRQGRREGSFRN